MIEEVCRELNNWFDTNPNDGTKNHYFGNFVIDGGMIDLSDIDIKQDQYFRIIGSVFNDGVYRYPAEGLADETFDGAVWTMAVPPAIITLSTEIDDWKAKYGTVDSVAMSPFISESFGGYSYSKSGGGAASDGNGTIQSGTWQSAFANRLNKWRKI